MKPTTLIKTAVIALMALCLAAFNNSSNAFASGPGGGGVGGGGGGGNPTQTIANLLRGPWESLILDTVLTVTFNNNGTFTATMQSPSGAIAADAGNWVVLPAVAPSQFANPQAHLVLTDTHGVLLSGDVLLIKLDQMVMLSATESVTTPTIVTELVLTKMTP